MAITSTKVSRETYTVSTILEAFDQGLLRDDHPQQRHANQHSNSYRDNFITTVIKNDDFDSIKTCEQRFGSSVVLWLIDGLQRISEIRAYKNDAFKLSKTIERPIIEYQIPKKDENGVEVRDELGHPIYETIQYDLGGKFYSDLPRPLQLQFESCPIEVIKHLNCNDDDIAYHIRRYNRQTTMNGAQIGVTYAEKRAALIKNVSANRFFLDCGRYTSNEINKGIVDRVVMESVVSVFHLNDWKKQTNRMGQYINENVTKEEFDILNGYFNRLYDIAEGKYEDIFNTKNTFIFMPVYHEFTKLGLPEKKFGEFLDAFSEDLIHTKVEGVSFDDLNENRGTKDKSLILKKIHLLIELMNNYVKTCTNEEMNQDSQNEQNEIAEIDENANEKENKEKDDITILSELTGYESDEIRENLNFFCDCLEDSLDRTVGLDSPIRDKTNKLPLIAVLIHGYEIEADVEDWIEWYATNVKEYPSDIEKNYQEMVHSLEQFDILTQKIA